MGHEVHTSRFDVPRDKISSQGALQFVWPLSEIYQGVVLIGTIEARLEVQGPNYARAAGVEAVACVATLC